MLFNISFDIASICIFILIYIISITFYTISNKNNIYFRFFIYFMLVANVLDITAAFFISYPYTVGTDIKLLVIYLYHLSTIIGIFFVSFFMQSCINSHKKAIYIINITIAIIYLALLFSNIFTNQLFYFRNRLYLHGRFHFLLLILPLLIVLTTCTSFIFKIKDLTNKEILVNILYFLISITVCYLQLKYPQTLLVSFATSIISLIMMFSLETPDSIKSMELQKKYAEETNNSRTEFFVKMSHEIRTPVNTIMGMNEMILREAREPLIRKYAMDVKTSVNTLLSLVNDILDFSKIESGKMELISTNYRLDELLNDVINMIRIKAEDKGLAFHVDIQQNIPKTYIGDDLRLRQILINLLTNAVKYTPSGTVSLIVSGVQLDENTETLHFEVMDTGIGIKEADLPLISQTYQRLDSNKNKYVEGTGLGLNIVTNLLKKMNSSLEIDSIYGKGSLFFFYLDQPIVSSEPIGNISEALRTKSFDYQYEIPFIAPKAKILIVDDNSLNRKVFRELLKKLQMEIIDVESGQKALEMVEDIHFDLIFLDHMMPELDGIETLHIMKKQELNRSKDTPIIVLTANAIANPKEFYTNEGFDDYLAKPITPALLERTVKVHLPKEKIQEVPEEMKLRDKNIEEEETLPDLEEFDWKIARTYFPNQNLLLDTLKNLYDYMPTQMKELSELYKDIENPDNLKSYRINVHALKSSMNAVGGLLLSKLARLCEISAQEENIKKIRALHPILMEEMEKHHSRLEFFSAKEESNSELIGKDTLKDLLLQLETALDEYDYQIADNINDELAKYNYPEQLKPLIEELRINIHQLKTSDSKKCVVEIKEKLKNRK